jgi:hypothetical protein
MNPNQDPNVVDPNLNTAIGASEYLDQISAKPKGGKFLDKKMRILLGGLLAVIIIVIIIVISSSNRKTTGVSDIILKAKTQYDNALQIIKYGVNSQKDMSSKLARNNAIASLVIGTHDAEMAAKTGKSKLSKEAIADLRDPKQAQDSLKSSRDAGRLDSEYKDIASLFIKDVIDTLSTVEAVEGATQDNKDMAAKYIEELETIKTRIEQN